MRGIKLHKLVEFIQFLRADGKNLPAIFFKIGGGLITFFGVTQDLVALYDLLKGAHAGNQVEVLTQF